MDDEEAEAARAEADGLRQFEQTCVAWDKQKGGLLRLTEKFLGLVEGRNGHDDPAVYLPKLAVPQRGQSVRLGDATTGHHGLHCPHLKAFGCPPHSGREA